MLTGRWEEVGSISNHATEGVRGPARDRGPFSLKKEQGGRDLSEELLN